MAPNPSLSQLFAALNAAPHPDMGTAYFAHVGSHLALARTIPPAWFPKTSAATEAQIGGLIANLHSLTTVDWGAYPLDGAATLMAWMIGNGSVLLAAIDQACAAEGLTPGGEAVYAETQARVMLNYAEVTTATAHAVFRQIKEEDRQPSQFSGEGRERGVPECTAARHAVSDSEQTEHHDWDI